MRRRTTGQSIVEMAFVAPVLFVVLFGIIDMGYLIFAYASVSQAARNGAEVAAELPPYQTWLNYENTPPGDAEYSFAADKCVQTILKEIDDDTTLFNSVSNFATISYPNGGESRNLNERGPIQVEIKYPVEGLTPLFRLLNISDGRLTLSVTVRRSIENLGLDPSSPTKSPCARDMADWRFIRDNS